VTKAVPGQLPRPPGRPPAEPIIIRTPPRRYDDLEIEIPDGRVCHRWYERGVRPPGLADQRFDSLYLFTACRPGTDEAFALAPPEAIAASRAVFLARFARELGPGVHAALILDRAGWHLARAWT
jgi:hypothetical protein